MTDRISSPDNITLSREEALVALAYLGPNPTYDTLAQQVAQNAVDRRMAQVQLPDLMPGVDIDAALRAEAPELFTVTVPADAHRAALVGAFTLALGIEGSEPSEPLGIVDFEPEEVVELATGARASLLAS